MEVGVDFTTTETSSFAEGAQGEYIADLSGVFLAYNESGDKISFSDKIMLVFLETLSDKQSFEHFLYAVEHIRTHLLPKRSYFTVECNSRTITHRYSIAIGRMESKTLVLAEGVAVQLCEIASNRSHILCHAAREVLNTVLFQSDFEIAFAYACELNIAMAQYALRDDLTTAEHIFEVLIGRYTLSGGRYPDIAAYTENMAYAHWGIHQIELCNSLGHWIDVTQYEVALLLRQEELYRSWYNRGYSYEIVNGKFELPAEGMRRVIFKFLYHEVTSRRLQEIIEGISSGEHLGLKIGNERLILCKLLQIPVGQEARVQEDLGINLSRVAQQVIVWNEKTSKYTLDPGAETYEFLIDQLGFFTSAEGDLPFLAKHLIGRRMAGEGTLVRACIVGGRFQVNFFSDDEGERLIEGHLPEDEVRRGMIWTYRQANQEERIVGAAEMADMSVYLYNRVSQIYWYDFKPEFTPVVREVEKKAKGVRAYVFSRYAWSIKPSGDIIHIPDDAEIKRELGINAIHFTPTDPKVLSGCVQVTVQADNSHLRFIVDNNLKVFVQGEREVQDAIDDQNEVLNVFGEEAGFWYYILILGAMDLITSREIVERANSVRSGSSRASSADVAGEVQREIEGGERGHKRRYRDGGRMFTKRQLERADMSGIPLIEINRRAGTLVEIPTIDEEGQERIELRGHITWVFIPRRSKKGLPTDWYL